jgi:hypothetical protein
MDYHIHAAITEGLQQRGVDVLTAHEDRTSQLDEEELRARATQLGRGLFSQDEDLLTLTNRWLQTDRVCAGLVYAHQLGVTMVRRFVILSSWPMPLSLKTCVIILYLYHSEYVSEYA